MKQGKNVQVILKGRYNDVDTDIRLLISPEGRMEINYLINGQLMVSCVKQDFRSIFPKRWSNSNGNVADIGLLSGRSLPVMRASLYNPNQVAYGERPQQPWQMDTHNYYYWADAGANCDRPLTQMAKGMKENIYYYTLNAGNPSTGLSVISPDASVACRSNKRADGQLIRYVNNRWDYPEIAWKLL